MKVSKVLIVAGFGLLIPLISGVVFGSNVELFMNYGMGKILAIKKNGDYKKEFNFSHIDYEKRADYFLERIDFAKNSLEDGKKVADFIEQRFKAADNLLTKNVFDDKKFNQEFDIYLNANVASIGYNSMGMEFIRKNTPYLLLVRNVYAAMVMENSFYATFKALGLSFQRAKNKLENIFDFIDVTISSQEVFDNYLDQCFGWNNIADIELAVSCCFSLAILNKIEKIKKKAWHECNKRSKQRFVECRAL